MVCVSNHENARPGSMKMLDLRDEDIVDRTEKNCVTYYKTGSHMHVGLSLGWWWFEFDSFGTGITQLFQQKTHTTNKKILSTEEDI